MTTPNKSVTSPAQSIVRVLEHIENATYSGPGSPCHALQLMEQIVRGSIWPSFEVAVLEKALSTANRALGSRVQGVSSECGSITSNETTQEIEAIDENTRNASPSTSTSPVGECKKNPFLERFGVTKP